MDQKMLPLRLLFPGSIIIKEFPYYTTIMDYAIIVADNMIEIEHKTSKTDYANDFKKIVKAGRKVFNKHSAIKNKKFIDNKFYFLCPSRMLASSEIPEYAGLITYRVDKDGNYILKIQKEAPKLHENYLDKSFYKTCTGHLFNRVEALTQLLSIKNEISHNSVNNPTNKRKGDTKRRKAIPNTGGGPAARRVKKKKEA
mgnify:CR=1 FL=1